MVRVEEDGVRLLWRGSIRSESVYDRDSVCSALATLGQCICEREYMNEAGACPQYVRRQGFMVRGFVNSLNKPPRPSEIIGSEGDV